jgi:hypothetical protein
MPETDRPWPGSPGAAIRPTSTAAIDDGRARDRVFSRPGDTAQAFGLRDATAHGSPEEPARSRGGVDAQIPPHNVHLPSKYAGPPALNSRINAKNFGQFAGPAQTVAVPEVASPPQRPGSAAKPAQPPPSLCGPAGRAASTCRSAGLQNLALRAVEDQRRSPAARRRCGAAALLRRVMSGDAPPFVRRSADQARAPHSLHRRVRPAAAAPAAGARCRWCA